MHFSSSKGNVFKASFPEAENQLTLKEKKKVE